MYAAEALCILNRPQEAAEHVSPAMVGDLLLSEPDAAASGASKANPNAGGEDDEGSASMVDHPLHLYCTDSGEHDPAHARCHLYVNMASVFVTQGELKKAEKCCEQAILAAPEDTHAVHLRVYLELKNGQTEGALEALTLQRASPAKLDTRAVPGFGQ